MENLISLPGNNLQSNLRYLRHHYGISISYPASNLVVSYEIHVYFHAITAHGHTQLTLNRKNFLINEQPPTEKIYALALRYTEQIYPVTIALDTNYRICKIVNHKEILNRCKEAQAGLTDYYTGEGAEACVRTVNNVILNPNTMISGLEYDLFNSLCLPPVYTAYTNFSADMQFPLTISGKRCRLPSRAVVAPVYNEQGRLAVSLQGVQKELSFRAAFNFYAEDHVLHSVSGHASHTRDDNERGEFSFEVWHLNPEERIIDRAASFRPFPRNNEPNIILDAAPVTRTKKWWNPF